MSAAVALVAGMVLGTLLGAAVVALLDDLIIERERERHDEAQQQQEQPQKHRSWRTRAPWLRHNGSRGAA